MIKFFLGTLVLGLFCYCGDTITYKTWISFKTFASKKAAIMAVKKSQSNDKLL